MDGGDRPRPLRADRIIARICSTGDFAGVVTSTGSENVTTMVSGAVASHLLIVSVGRGAALLLYWSPSHGPSPTNTRSIREQPLCLRDASLRLAFHATSPIKILRQLPDGRVPHRHRGRAESLREFLPAQKSASRPASTRAWHCSSPCFTTVTQLAQSRPRSCATLARSAIR